ncbi:hypothetical protein QR64_17565 [Rhodococcus sp. Chr-9]|nr:hypothetical protein QR64_17565 [Rhodococcus sp. Chr-9]
MHADYADVGHGCFAAKSSVMGFRSVSLLQVIQSPQAEQRGSRSTPFGTSADAEAVGVTPGSEYLLYSKPV